MRAAPSYAALVWLLATLACTESPGGGVANDAGTPQDAADAALGVTPPTVVLSVSAASTYEAEAHLVASADGSLLAVWSAFGSRSVANGYALSRDRGLTWTPASVLNERGFGDPIATAGPDGSFYYGFLAGNCTGGGCNEGHVWVTKLAKGSNTFGPPIDVSPADPAAFYDKPWLMTASDGTILNVFNSRVGVNPDNIDAIVVARTKDGSQWTRTFAVTEQAKGVIAGIPHACISPTGSRVWIVYVDSQSPVFGSIRWSDDIGETWPSGNVSSSFALPSENTRLQVYDLRCVGSEDNVWVMYGIASGSSSANSIPPLTEIRVAHSRDRGKTWARSTITDNGLMFLRPEILLEPSGALDVVAYTGTNDGDAAGAMRVYRSVDEGVTFGTGVEVFSPIRFTGDRSSPLWIGDYSGFAFDGKYVMGTYADNASGKSHIVFAAKPWP